jgi:integrase
MVREADPAQGYQHPITDVGRAQTRHKGAERQAKFVATQVAMNIELKLKVEDLNARYAQAIDDDKLEAWPDFFIEQGRYRVTTAENFERGLPLGMIYATSRAMLRDRVRSLREAYRHGLRASEVCDLQWQQIVLSEGRLHRASA